MSKSKYSRKTPFRQPKEEVLVVCGGQTEQIYFDAFKQAFRPFLGNINVVTAVAIKSPVQIVEYAIKARQRKDNYIAVWCVFDKDDFIDFDEAINYAHRNGVYSAFSNQAFEVWFINHFRLLDFAMHRNNYKKELSSHLPFQYDKSLNIVSKVCDALLTEDRVREAISNARYGYERHKSNTTPAKPSAYESSTTVFMLVRNLLRWTE